MGFVGMLSTFTAATQGPRVPPSHGILLPKHWWPMMNGPQIMGLTYVYIPDCNSGTEPHQRTKSLTKK